MATDQNGFVNNNGNRRQQRFSNKSKPRENLKPREKTMSVDGNERTFNWCFNLFQHLLYNSKMMIEKPHSCWFILPVKGDGTTDLKTQIDAWTIEITNFGLVWMKMKVVANVTWPLFYCGVNNPPIQVPSSISIYDTTDINTYQHSSGWIFDSL